MRNKQCIVVLGMHRSGTSCISGVLSTCGVQFGDVPNKSPFNEKGNMEITKDSELYDQILALHKGSWHEPPRFPIQIHDFFHNQLNDSFQKLEKLGDNIGYKNPRILLMLDAFMQLAPKDTQIIGSFRHPMAVAKSLQMRNGFSIDKGLNLWSHYNKKLIDAHQQMKFPLIKFDLSNLQCYIDQIYKITSSLDLNPSQQKLEDYITANLDHHNSELDPIPENCSEIYNYLIANCYANR